MDTINYQKGQTGFEMAVAVGRDLRDARAFRTTAQLADYAAARYSISLPAAHNYMNIAREFGDTPNAELSTLEALATLSRPSVSPELRNRARQLIASGRVFNEKTARAFLNKPQRSYVRAAATAPAVKTARTHEWHAFRRVEWEATCQRNFSKDKADALAANWNPALATAPVLVAVGDRLILVDGQHRFYAMQQRGEMGAEFRVIRDRGQTAKDRASLTVELNSVTPDPINGVDLIRIGANAGIRKYTTIVDGLRAAGVAIPGID